MPDGKWPPPLLRRIRSLELHADRVKAFARRDGQRPMILAAEAHIRRPTLVDVDVLNESSPVRSSTLGANRIFISV